MPLLIETLRATVKRDFVTSRELSLALTKLDEFELWLTRCDTKEEIGDGQVNRPLP